jgi:hypothetical protein
VISSIVFNGCATQGAHVGEESQGSSNFKTEWARAVDDSRTGSAGQAWEAAVNSALEQGLEDVYDGCEIERKQDIAAGFVAQKFVLDVARDGRIRQAWSETESPFSTCARRRLSRIPFAPPPKDGQRLGIILELQEH